jgi:transcriptional regulator with XRE-family HTH domain
VETYEDFTFNHDLLIEAVEEERQRAKDAQRRFTISGLAKQLKISRQYLNRLLAKEQSPSLSIVVRIQRRFPGRPFLPIVETEVNNTSNQDQECA